MKKFIAIDMFLHEQHCEITAGTHREAAERFAASVPFSNGSSLVEDTVNCPSIPGARLFMEPGTNDQDRVRVMVIER